MPALSALRADPHASPAATASAPMSVPVVGAVASGGRFSGVFALSAFAVQNGAVVAVGTLSGVIAPRSGAGASIRRAVTMPIAVGQASDSVLHLDLGPLSLNLLGLQVNLHEIVLDITVQRKSQHPLAKLIGGVAAVRDNVGGMTRLLNQILAALEPGRY